MKKQKFHTLSAAFPATTTAVSPAFAKRLTQPETNAIIRESISIIDIKIYENLHSYTLSNKLVLTHTPEAYLD